MEQPFLAVLYEFSVYSVLLGCLFPDSVIPTGARLLRPACYLPGRPDFLFRAELWRVEPRSGGTMATNDVPNDFLRALCALPLCPLC